MAPVTPCARRTLILELLALTLHLGHFGVVLGFAPKRTILNRLFLCFLLGFVLLLRQFAAALLLLFLPLLLPLLMLLLALLLLLLPLLLLRWLLHRSCFARPQIKRDGAEQMIGHQPFWMWW